MDTREEYYKREELEMNQSNVMLEWMTSLAKTLFTALIMINGGAIISLLTFIGNSEFTKNFSSLWIWSVSCYCLGIVSVLIAMSYAFCAQKVFREGFDKDIQNNTETDWVAKNKEGVKYRQQSIYSTIASIISFIVGSIVSIVALGETFINA